MPRTAIQFNKRSDIVGTHTCKDYYRVPLVKHKPHLPCEHPRAIQGKIGSTNCAPLKQNMVVSLAAHSFYPENVMAAYIHSHSRKTQLMSVPSQRRHAPGSRDVWWRYRVGEIYLLVTHFGLPRAAECVSIIPRDNTLLCREKRSVCIPWSGSISS